MEYLATWQYLDGSKGSEPFSDFDIAVALVSKRINLMGGLGCVVRMSDFVTVFRLWYLKEESAHAA